jgi:hypothetical protein
MKSEPPREDNYLDWHREPAGECQIDRTERNKTR